MASETKVGLIAGLTFIICFSVILANRGRHQVPYSAQSGIAMPRGPAAGDWQVDLPPGVAEVVPTGSAESVGMLPRASTAGRHSRDAIRPEAGRPVESAAPTGGETAPVPRRSGTVSINEPAAHRLTQDAPGEPDAGGALRTAFTAVSQDAATRLALLEQRLDELAGELKGSGTPPAVPLRAVSPEHRPPRVSTPSAAGSTGTSGAAPVVHYTVKTGDTLSKIARVHYGESSARYIGAIFNANRSILSSPDKVFPGMVLIMPAPETGGDAQPAGAGLRRTEPPARHMPVRRERSTSATWYQIRKNDRYVSIAREQLGDGTRWPEIHELNKDKFPDPAHIREGVRIKLPQRRLVSTTERRP
ncbi:MAG: LysM peptidoglycan-binding domain-containing protein [Phycisphaerae bacterium]